MTNEGEDLNAALHGIVINMNRYFLLWRCKEQGRLLVSNVHKTFSKTVKKSICDSIKGCNNSGTKTELPIFLFLRFSSSIRKKIEFFLDDPEKGKL